MTPLGNLPPSDSPAFSLNAVDWMKILRALIVQVVGLFVTLGVPYFTKFKYTYKGADYTPLVLVLVNTMAEAGRRFLAGQGIKS